MQPPPIPPRYKLQAPRPQHVRVARPRTRPPFVCAPPHPAAFFGTEPNVRCTAIPTYRVPSLRLFWPSLIGKICRIGRMRQGNPVMMGVSTSCLMGHPLTAGDSQPVNYPTALVIFRSSPSLMALARPAGCSRGRPAGQADPVGPLDSHLGPQSLNQRHKWRWGGQKGKKYVAG